MFIVLKLFAYFNATIKNYIQIFCTHKDIINEINIYFRASPSELPFCVHRWTLIFV